MLAAAGLTAGYVTAALVLGAAGLRRLRSVGGVPAKLAEEISAAASATARMVGQSVAMPLTVRVKWLPLLS
ncbi:hypothetical protein [Dactylosporangium sp. NPDC000521]|uniref:hypothetical protein n=1 Tax=Dactylosporangium sp. NPDC000521 TaxID=3363975 RepID=UPI0036B9589D